ANDQAAIQPSLDNYMNAIQIYPYTVGALYQVYAAPEQVTDIALQPGEKLMALSAGDTVRWIVGDTSSGSGGTEQVHILVKPTQPGLKTNLIIITSHRAYHLELRAFRETYMAAVSWRYPDQPLVTEVSGRGAEPSARDTFGGIDLDQLKFRYEITGDEPHWRPVRAFDDGHKVYIQFPGRLDQGEAPPLFVVGRDGRSQLVNYRMRDSYYEVDRLFAAAELRLGEKRQDVVRITRTDLEMARR
ncbi:MAG: P-type conjugative transfer protein TrbG, partial [Pseudomonadota bacterium]